MSNTNGRTTDKDTARSIVQFVQRNRWLIFGVPVATLVLTAFFIAWTTPVYMGETVIRVDKERSNIAVLDALQELSNGASIYTEIAELKSRTVAEDVVDSLDLHLGLVTPRRDPRSKLFAALEVERDAPAGKYTLTGLNGGRYRLTAEKGQGRDVAIGVPFHVPGATLTLAASAREHNTIRFKVAPFPVAVRDLQANIDVRRPDREADMVEITYEHTDRELAQAIPNTTARLFIQRRQAVKSQQARSTVSFLNDQIDTLGQQLRGYEGGLQQFREGQGVVSLEAEGEAQVSRLADFQANRDIAEAERASLAKLTDEIRRTPVTLNEPSPYRRLLGFPTILSNPAAGEMMRSLNDMENQRAELLTKRTRQDPDVIVLSTRIHEMEDQLQSLVATYLQGLTNRIASLDGVLNQFSDDLKRIPAKEIQLARLKRQAKITEDIYTVLQQRMKEAQIASAILDPSVRVVDPAIEPLKPVSPNKPLDIVLALILGIALGGGIAFVRENLDTTIHTREQLQLETGTVPVLGLIPRIRDTVKATNGARRPLWKIRTPVIASPELIRARLVAGRNPRGSASEAYRALRTNLAFAQPGKTPRTLVFTSAAPGDGKSTSSSNLAITLAQQGLRCILIDADLRRGGMHVALETTDRPGLSDYLIGGLSMEEVIRRVQLQDVELDFIPRGTVPPNPAELLAATRMQALLEHLEGEYDTVIFDAPPMNVVTDAAILGSRTDGVIVVVRAGVTDRSALHFALDQLVAVRARVLGCVLNDIDEKRDRYYGSELAGSYYEAHT
ncbi:MAG TPA: polysaccharide biosynthesis tyrosine autokinase [Longimicrobiales bacterium]|nr:polysaccharide biosynthesis tyrosine autokinase [Longimicrobiales bacterium]